MAGPDERHFLFEYLEKRFGIPERIFDDYLLCKRRKSWDLVRNATHIVSASQLKVFKVGLKAFRKVGAYVKPTTRMIQIFGQVATRSKIQIDQEQLLHLVDGKELLVHDTIDNGYVILALSDNRIVGLGFLMDGKLRTQLPRKELRKAMLGKFP